MTANVSKNSIIFTESATKKLVTLLSEENSSDSFLRVYHNRDQDWGFSFEEDSKYQDEILDYPEFKVLVDQYTLKSIGEETTVDYNESTDSFGISNGLKLTDNEDENSGCKHVRTLPRLPYSEELPSLRKGLRKQKLPEIYTGWHGRHDQIGEFNILEAELGFEIEWTLLNNDKKQFKFNELCIDPERELDRLEFGWMVANLAALDKIHESEAVNMGGNPVHEIQERARVWNFYEKIEKKWRHWAIVRANHMIF